MRLDEERRSPQRRIKLRVQQSQLGTTTVRYDERSGEIEIEKRLRPTESAQLNAILYTILLGQLLARLTRGDESVEHDEPRPLHALCHPDSVVSLSSPDEDNIPESALDEPLDPRMQLFLERSDQLRRRRLVDDRNSRLTEVPKSAIWAADDGVVSGRAQLDGKPVIRPAAVVGCLKLRVLGLFPGGDKRAELIPHDSRVW